MRTRLGIFVLFVTLLYSTAVSNCFAQETEEVLQPSLLVDINGDQVVTIVAFGDSLTRGTGDFIPAGEDIEILSTSSEEAGYPLRIEQRLGLSVLNRGDPGERLTENGLYRFAQIIPALRPDIVVISEGANDSFAGVDASRYFTYMQTAINIARALNITVVAGTIPTPCCNHSGISVFVSAYNQELRLASAVNNLRLADIQHAFQNTCRVGRCELLNLPEGLHPNIEGYDVMGETVIAALYGINLFAPDGPALLEQALALPPGSVRTRPDPVT